MSPTQLVNAAALAFAGFAAWMLLRQSSGASAPALLSTQPAQRARDSGAQAWMDLATQQWANLYPAIPQASYDETERLLKRYPAPPAPTP